MKYFILCMIILFSLSFDENYPNDRIRVIEDVKESSISRTDKCYFVNSSAFDTNNIHGTAISNHVDLRSVPKFKKLKLYAEEVSKNHPYYLIINKVADKPTTIFGELNNDSIKIFAEYCFFIIDTIEKWNQHPTIKLIYYDQTDSIQMDTTTDTKLMIKIINNDDLIIQIDEIKPNFMFDVSLIQIEPDNEKLVFDLSKFWRFKAECEYMNIDYLFYEHDAYFIFDFLRELARYEIFTQKFGQTDYDYP
ncbi:MAG: hypothetical protein KGZ71_02060 [Desulfobulbaceae bacterium]|nr:hypothetical protein [Desulfobulbaceae bacterium]